MASPAAPSEREDFRLLEEDIPEPVRVAAARPSGPGISPSERRRVVWLVLAMVFLFSTSYGLSGAPMTRIMEANICRSHYMTTEPEKKELDEQMCKTDEVQSELAYLHGLMHTLDALVGLLVAFPYGMLADRIGRKPILVLSTAGGALSACWIAFVLWFRDAFPTRLVLVASIFHTIGGGGTVGISVIHSVIADVVLEADRARSFFRMSVAALGGSFIGPLIASKLMEATSPWVPAFIHLILTPAILTILVVFFPETLHYTKARSNERRRGLAARQMLSPKFYLASGLRDLQKSLSILNSLSVILLLATSLTHTPEVMATTQFFIQYVSRRFSWSLAQAGYLLTIRSVITMIMLLGVLPGLERVLCSSDFGFQLSTPAKDLALARASAFCAAFGALFMAGTSLGSLLLGLSINTLAAGFFPLCRSLAASYTKPQDTSKMYILISITESIGAMFAGPSLAWLFSTGMKWKGIWLGLPYFALTVSFVLVACALAFVRVRDRANLEEDSNHLVETTTVTGRESFELSSL